MMSYSKMNQRQRRNHRFSVFAIVLSILSISTSCNIEKRIERRQEAFDKVGRKWLSQHPCANDSTYIYLPGKRDSIPLIVPVLVKDSNSIRNAIDSITRIFSVTNAHEDCEEEITYAYNKGYDKASKEWAIKLSKIKVPVPVIDTVKITLKDKQEIKLLEADLREAKAEINELKLSGEKRLGSKRSWFLLFVISTLVALLSLFYNAKKYMTDEYK